MFLQLKVPLAMLLWLGPEDVSLVVDALPEIAQEATASSRNSHDAAKTAAAGDDSIFSGRAEQPDAGPPITRSSAAVRHRGKRQQDATQPSEDGREAITVMDEQMTEAADIEPSEAWREDGGAPGASAQGDPKELAAEGEPHCNWQGDADAAGSGSRGNIRTEEGGNEPAKDTKTHARPHKLTEIAHDVKAQRLAFLALYRHRRRTGGGRLSLQFCLFFVAWCGGLWTLSEIYLLRFGEHGCSGLGQLLGGTSCDVAATTGGAEWQALHGQARHWARETFGFQLMVQFGLLQFILALRGHTKGWPVRLSKGCLIAGG